MMVSDDLHEEALEEVLEIPLSGRVREVSNVQTTTFSCTGDNGLVLRGVGGFAASGVVGSS